MTFFLMDTFQQSVKLNGLIDVCFIQRSMRVSKLVLDSLGVADSDWAECV